MTAAAWPGAMTAHWALGGWDAVASCWAIVRRGLARWQPASAVCGVHDAEEGAVWGGDQQVSDVVLVHPLAGGVEVLVR